MAFISKLHRPQRMRPRTWVAQWPQRLAVLGAVLLVLALAALLSTHLAPAMARAVQLMSLPLSALLGWALLLHMRLRSAHRWRAELQASDALHLDLLARYTHNAIIFADRKGRITWANTACEDLLGYSLHVLRGQTLATLFKSEGAESTARQQFQDALRLGHDCLVDIRITGRDAQAYWVAVELIALHDDAGQCTGFMSIQVDVTERVHNEQRLHAALSELSELMGAVRQHAIVSLTDARGVIIDVNEAFCALSGYSPQALLGATHRIINSGTHDHTFWHDFWQTISAGQPWYGEICNRNQHGQLYWVSSLVAPLRNASGHIERYLSIRFDITARKLAEQAVDALRIQAEQANQAKSAFLANMSHEIRTPMNAVLGMLQLLRGTPLTAQQQNYLSHSESASKALLGIINDILDFSKIEAGQMELAIAPVVLSDLWRDVHMLYAASLHHKPLDLVWDIDPQLPPVVLADALRLQQVLLNLGSNAIKFTESGRVTLRVRRLADPATANVRLQVAVTDTGIGISPAQQQRLFGAFVQAESSITRKYGGTGLGLTISQRLLHLMGSRLTVQSALGQGSTFGFALTLPVPAHAGDALPPPTTTRPVHSNPADPPLHNLRILLVEDNALNQQVAQELLARQGALVELAENGQQAVDRLQAASASVDAVLMDMQMPVMDGLEATRIIRQRLGLHDLPIIAMTANAMAHDRLACQQAGMNEHIGKPFAIEQVVATLLRWTGPDAHTATAQNQALAQPAPTAPPSEPATAALLDVAAALARLAHDDGLLQRLLTQFEAELTAQQPQWQQRLAQPTPDPALAADLHTLKGTASTLGAAALAHSADQAVHALKANAPAHAALQHVAVVLTPTLAALHDWLATRPTHATLAQHSAADPVHWQAALQQLLDLLRQREMHALDAHEQLLNTSALAHDPRWTDLHAAMDALDFAAAASAVEQLLSSTPPDQG